MKKTRTLILLAIVGSGLIGCDSHHVVTFYGKVINIEDEGHQATVHFTRAQIYDHNEDVDIDVTKSVYRECRKFFINQEVESFRTVHFPSKQTPKQPITETLKGEDYLRLVGDVEGCTIVKVSCGDKIDKEIIVEE